MKLEHCFFSPSAMEQFGIVDDGFMVTVSGVNNGYIANEWPMLVSILYCLLLSLPWIALYVFTCTATNSTVFLHFYHVFVSMEV